MPDWLGPTAGLHSVKKRISFHCSESNPPPYNVLILFLFGVLNDAQKMVWIGLIWLRIGTSGELL
jgi:hypothetical protein